jgi:uncharacterized damage-inducible protein DinB
MTIAELLLPEFDHEMANTRKLLERIPEDRFDYTPHPKSMTLGRLASHVAEMPDWLVVTMTMEVFEPGPDMTGFKASSKAAVLEKFDTSRSAARDTLAKASDADMAIIWTFKWNGQVVLSMPRHAVLRSLVFNHLVHHRAQLGVYLRLLDIPIPGMYGPSADESAAM